MPADEMQAVKDVATHPATGGLGLALIGWLANKVWRGYRHEINNIKQDISALTEVVTEKADKEDVRDMQTDIRAIRASVEHLTLVLLKKGD
jgi:hypothetical protein